jgi:hypothetical protein
MACCTAYVMSNSKILAALTSFSVVADRGGQVTSNNSGSLPPIGHCANQGAVLPRLHDE